MTHVRTTLRTDLRVALADAIPEITWDRRWWMKGSDQQLPRGGVAINRSSDQRTDQDSVERAVQILVIVKILGGDDIDDELDALSARAERAVLSHLDGVAALYSLRETALSVDDKGERPKGELVMEFTAALWTEFGEPEELE